MLISEFCKIYKVHHQYIYRAEKNDKALEGHIFLNVNNVKELDDFAIEYCKPKRITAEKYNQVCEENYRLENEICVVRANNMTLNDKIKDMERECDKEKAAVDLAKSEADKYREMSGEKDKLLKVKDELISDKDSRIAELEDALAAQIKLCTKYEADILVKESENSDLRGKIDELTAELEYERSKGFFGHKKK